MTLRNDLIRHAYKSEPRSIFRFVHFWSEVHYELSRDTRITVLKNAKMTEIFKIKVNRKLKRMQKRERKETRLVSYGLPFSK